MPLIHRVVTGVGISAPRALIHRERSIPKINLEALREIEAEEIAYANVLTAVPVKKPHRDDFFRVHPDPSYTLTARMLQVKDAQERERLYLLSEDLLPTLGEHEGNIKVKKLFTCVTSHEVTFLWPANTPNLNNELGRSWAVSGLKIAEEAKNTWVRMSGKPGISAYVYTKAQGDLGEPKWLDMTFQELLDIAFEETYVDTMDHQAIKTLTGQV